MAFAVSFTRSSPASSFNPNSRFVQIIKRRSLDEMIDRGASRRQFLRAAGIGICLPILDRFTCSARGDDNTPQRKRIVTICTTLGLHGPDFFPQAVGAGYEPSPYLRVLGERLSDVTVFSGLSHPEQSGSDGHSSERTWLTSAAHPGLGGFRNTLSFDQLAAERLGYVTRFPSLVIGTSHSSQSYTRSGVMIPAVARPSELFAQLFLDGTAEQVASEVRRLGEGRSILDSVSEEAKRIARTSGRRDRQRLAEYFESVREMERRLHAAEAWSQRPKPHVDAEPPAEIQNEADLIGRTELMFELIPLALQTDSSRVIAMTMQGRNDVPPVPGVSIDHHNLSHHGQDEAKIAQLKLIEMAQMRALAKLLAALHDRTENGARLLDHTAVLFGSNLGNANSHDWRNLPILLAGGGFKHGEHRAFDAENNTPLANLFVTLLQSQGHTVDAFGSSTSALSL